LIAVESEMEIKICSTLKSLLTLIICSYVTSFNNFLFARNLDCWFLGTSYFIYVDKLDGNYGRSLFSDRSFINVSAFFLSALMYTVVLYHSEGNSEVMFHKVLVIIAKLVIKNVMCMDVNGYLWLFMMLTG
jgi:hypothetical protein